mgnify:CR=1 FL=1
MKHITPPIPSAATHSYISEKSSVDKFQTRGLIILVVITFGAEVFYWGNVLYYEKYNWSRLGNNLISDMGASICTASSMYYLLSI